MSTTAHGTHLEPRNVNRAWKALCERAGVRRIRLHDLRHTFAVSTLRAWHADGVDVQRRLPALSTYLGHLNPNNTYWYLQAVPELMAVVAERLERFHGARP